jgi:putative ABC transport system permease protein
MRTLWSKLRAVFRGRRGLAEDLREEIAAHLEFEAEDRLSRGMTPEQARLAARRRFGNTTLTAERARDAWTFSWFENLIQDIRYALRGMRGSPGFALIVVLTLALGIGANTAIFSVVYSALLRPLPYPGGERLVVLEESTPKAPGISVTWINFQHWRTENHSFEDMAGYQRAEVTLTGRGDPSMVRVGIVTSHFLSMLGGRPLLGRCFSEGDDRFGAARTAVLSHKFWAQKLGGDPNAIGAVLALNGREYRVIGVAPPGLSFIGFGDVDLYVSLGLSQNPAAPRSAHGSTRLLARLREGVTLSAGLGDLDSIMKRLAQTDPGPESEHRAFGRFLADEVAGDMRSTLLVVIGAVGLVLLIACANVASLAVAKSSGRAGEIALRSAIGAGRGRLMRQLLTENLVMATVGGLAGLGLAELCLRVLIAAAPAGVPRLAEARLDFRVLLFAAAITIITGLLAGFAPMWTARKPDLASALKDFSRSSGARRGHALRGALVIAEIAITLVLAFAAGLLVRSLLAALTANPGFDAERLTAVEVALPSATYRNKASLIAFYDRFLDDLRRLPGVTAVTAVNCAPSAGDCGDWFYSVLGKPQPARGSEPITLFNTADAGYFRTMRIPLREGREFTDADRASGPPVAIINETFARMWWPKEPAVGHQIKFGGPYQKGDVFEIIGVAGDVSQMGLDRAVMPEIYLPFGKSEPPPMTVMVRVESRAAALAPAIRARLAAIDRNVPIQRIRPLASIMAATLERRRFGTTLLVCFAGLAMILAAVGIYGLLKFWVSVREYDIAIRLALGASPRSIAGWTGLEALRLAGAGLALGALGGWAASRWMKALVFGVSARNPLTMIAAALAVLMMAGIAAAAPVWRATRVDPVRKLHRA